MATYMSRLFPRSNSSFLLSSGKALTAEVSRFKDDMFLVDPGIGTPKMSMRDELTRVPIDRTATSFENKVGFMDRTAGESLIKTQMLERFFMDLVAGDAVMKERATARFNELVGSTGAVAGEPVVLLPRRFRQNQVWMELNKLWRTKQKVRGFLVEKVRGGHSVAIAGFIAFLPFRAFGYKGSSMDRFTIEKINSKTKKFTVLR